MASLTLKNIPAKLLDQIRAIAERERRSMTQQVIYMLEQSVAVRCTESDDSAVDRVEET